MCIGLFRIIYIGLFGIIYIVSFGIICVGLFWIIYIGLFGIIYVGLFGIKYIGSFGIIYICSFGIKYICLFGIECIKIYWFGIHPLWQRKGTCIFYRVKMLELISDDLRWVWFPSSAMYACITVRLCFRRDLVEYLWCV